MYLKQRHRAVNRTSTLGTSGTARLFRGKILHQDNMLRGLLLLSAFMAVYSMNCREKMEDRLERAKNGEPMPLDWEFLKCDSAGDYQLKQCFGMWTGLGWCGCYKKKSGQRMDHIKGVTGRSPAAKTMTCQCAYDQLNSNKDLVCNPNTGDYSWMYCTKGKCVCSSKTGTVISSEFNEGESNCLCAIRESDYERLNIVGKLFKCNKDGSYRPKQQHGSMEYCVDKEGKQVGESVPVGQDFVC